jgi:uncharacterized protein (DUF58 family)
MQVDGSAPAMPRDEADFEPWLRLVDRLDATFAAAGGVQALRIFRALGPRRRADALRRLLRERQRLVLEIAEFGVHFLGAPILEPAGPPGRATLDTDYHGLADAFAHCAPIAHRLGKIALRQWLLDRARMHRQHALFLAT